MDEKKLFNVDQAIKYLDNTYVLASVADRHVSYFVKKGNRIVVSDENSRFTLSIEEFLALYSEAKFSLIEEEDELVDLKKDEEYYSWGKKM